MGIIILWLQMGCLKLTYHQEPKRPEFLGIWKSDSLKKTGTQNFFALGEKKTQPLFDVDYYPFGGTFNSYAQAPENKYLYNGKEEQKETGWYDYVARMQDPWLGRWNHIDPLSDSYLSTSPYVLALNNPINAIDPDGRLVIFVNGYNENAPLSTWLGLYNPDRNFHRSSPISGYWDGLDKTFMKGLHDNNALYVNAHSKGSSQASDRFKMGVNAAQNLIKQLEKGEITLKDGETIKIVGHSQGAAFAAGLLGFGAGILRLPSVFI